MHRPIEAQIEEALCSCLQEINKEEKGLPYIVQGGRLFSAVNRALEKGGYEIVKKANNS
jgi:hypothetical protein